MRRVLPVNKHPYLRSYTHHGYLHSIISSEDKVITDDKVSLADFAITDFSKYTWNNQSGKVSYTENNGYFKVFGNRWNLDLNMTFWRDCRKEDEIEVFIDKQLYINPWSSITLFITNLNQDMLNIDDFLVRAGNFSKDGGYYDVKGAKHSIINKNCIGKTIKLIKRSDNVFVQYKEYEKQYETKILELTEDADYKIGFSVALGNNSYFEWVFSNYINVYGNFGSIIPLDFVCNRKKDWNPHTSDYFFNYNCESLDDIRQLGFTELGYIKKMIDMGRYVEVDVNDNLNDGMTDENGAYFHQDLIYGYDDDNQELYLFYYDHGLMKESKISFDLYCSSRNYQINKKYYVYKYNPGYEHFSLSADYYLKKYIEFRDSVDISINENESIKTHVTGLNCYRKLLSSNVFSVVVNDIRISHVLTERSICNKDRIEYLIDRGILHAKECKILIEDLDKQCKDTSLLEFLILKRRLGGMVEDEKIQTYIASIVDMEIKITSEIINLLNSTMSKSVVL